MTLVDAIPTGPPATTVPPLRASRAPLRLTLLGRAFVLMFTSLTGVALFCFWVTAVAIAPITIAAPLVLPVTALVRRYADVHRRSASRAVGRLVERPYASVRSRGLRRVWDVVRDPASWRDAWWLLAHGVVATVTSALTVALFAGGMFYLSYPLLYAVTPQRVFGHPFTQSFTLHSVGQATIMMPLALVCFGLWYGLAVPLARAEVAVSCALLDRPRR